METPLKKWKIRRNRIEAFTLRCATAMLVATLNIAVGQELPKWRHGIVEAKSDAGIVMMASTREFARKQGIDLQYIQFNSDALALKALVAGGLDSYEGSPGSPITAASKGVDIKIVGCYWPGLTYGIFAKSSIKSVKDLIGKTIAISAPNSLPDIFTRVVLQKSGIKPSQVHFAALGGDATRFRALYAGAADAVAASTEYTPTLETGYSLILDAHDVAPEFVRLCTYMSSTTIAKHRPNAAGFLAAEMQALRFAMENRDEVIRLAKEATHSAATEKKAAYIFDEVSKYSAIDPTMQIPAEKLAWLQEILTQTGSVTKKVDIASLIDASVRAEALKLSQPH
jgi:NitT/TauT family transport system substrate-binding protein